MEKKIKIFKTITIVLMIIAVSLISFVGVFRNKLNFKENIIPDFTYGMEIDGAREFKFSLNTDSMDKQVYVDENGNIKGEVIEETTSEVETDISLDTTVSEAAEEVEGTDEFAEEDAEKPEFAVETRTIKENEDSVLNKESYEETKAIIQKRLEAAQIPEYSMRLDNITGDLTLEVPENDNAGLAYELALQQGEFQIIDAQNGVILMDNSDIKKASAVYYTDAGYQAILQIEFTKTGAEELKEISKKYIQITNEQGEDETKYVELRLDGNTLLQTYFGEELSQGILQVTMGNTTTDYEEFSESYDSASYFANILNTGKTPNSYSLASDNFVKSQITEEMILIAKVIFSVVIAIISLVLIIKYKSKGLLGAITGVGYIATTMLAIRYTNVTITLNSTLAILGIVIVNYVFIVNFLNRQKTDSAKHAFLESMKEINITIIPLWIVAIIFTFMTNVAISSVGMVMFWGLFVHVIYSFIVTRTLYV